MGIEIADGDTSPVLDGSNEVKVNKNSQLEGATYIVPQKNGDAKIDIGSPPEYSGLTKEGLMQYDNDPFWIKLRWVLFILCWAGWAAMLVVAVVIIVKTPGCTPPPTLNWMEEQTMVKVDTLNFPRQDELLEKCKSLEVNSVYLPNLINEEDFYSQSSTYQSPTLLEALKGEMKDIITDLPTLSATNRLFVNFSTNELIDKDGNWNFMNDKLPAAVYKEIGKVWQAKGVHGFLMKTEDVEERLRFKDAYNQIATNDGSESVIGGDVKDLTSGFSDVSKFKMFIEENSQGRKFYEFKPSYMAASLGSDGARLMDIGLFMMAGTPVLTSLSTIDNSTSLLIKGLSKMRHFDAIKFGEVNVANTTENIIAFTRTYKGTPAYAIALNFDSKAKRVDFSHTPHVADSATSHLISQSEADDFNTREKFDLKDVLVEANEGLIMQFVANF